MLKFINSGKTDQEKRKKSQINSKEDIIVKLQTLKR